MLLVIYVDDLIITGDSDEDILHVKRLLKQKFEMKDLGEYLMGYLQNGMFNIKLSLSRGQNL